MKIIVLRLIQAYKFVNLHPTVRKSTKVMTLYGVNLSDYAEFEVKDIGNHMAQSPINHVAIRQGIRILFEHLSIPRKVEPYFENVLLGFKRSEESGTAPLIDTDLKLKIGKFLYGEDVERIASEYSEWKLG